MYIPIKEIKNIIVRERKNFNMDKNKKKIDGFQTEVGEDATKYGEFISSYFAWVSLPQQKEKVEELQNMTKNNKKNRNSENNKENERK